MSEQEYQLSAHLRGEIDHLLAKFPAKQRRSAVLGSLTAAQHENNGYLTTQIMDAVADYLQLPRVAVYEVASFYSMYETEKVGRNSISVCTNVSCMLRGADRIVDHIEKRLGVKTGASTGDYKFFLKREEECLAACCGAPMMQINHKYYENLTPEKVDQILDSIE
jgi:NADH-quinone oxidoreductase subunit E